MSDHIYVTEADIDYGKRFSSKENPVCLAIRRIYRLWNVEVFPDRIVCTKLGHRKRTIKLTEQNKIYNFLLAFHSGMKTKPFRETIDLPG